MMWQIYVRDECYTEAKYGGTNNGHNPVDPSLSGPAIPARLRLDDDRRHELWVLTTVRQEQ